MIAARASSELDRFSRAITHRVGLYFDEAKLGFLGEVLQRRLDALKQQPEAYLRGLEKGPPGEELGALATQLTVGETYFFRNHEQFDALAQVVLPDRLAARGEAGALRILCAACASGDEAYTIAIVAKQALPASARPVGIRAVDLNPAVLEKARQARYSTWALRETPANVQKRWFHPEGRDFILDPSVRAAVSFEERNLAVDDDELWLPGAYDVVFCRNVLMYFAPDQAEAAVARIARSLAPGGYLFLGHAETLRGLSDDFHLRHTHNAFYYERKATIARPGCKPKAEAPPTPHPAADPASPLMVAVASDGWVDAIRKASERVEALAPAKGASRPAPATKRARDIGPAIDLMRKERFTEALARVRDGDETSDDPDALLLEAMLLAHGGEFSAAEVVCRRLLAIDELNAGARYALALCRESLGDREGAAEHDRVAVYLDPAFAMPRLHLGLLARHAGDRAGARRELSQALVLLQREDASRLLLFGGGFHRDALIALCQSALRASGGRP